MCCQTWCRWGCLGGGGARDPTSISCICELWGGGVIESSSSSTLPASAPFTMKMRLAPPRTSQSPFLKLCYVLDSPYLEVTDGWLERQFMVESYQQQQQQLFSAGTAPEGSLRIEVWGPLGCSPVHARSWWKESTPEESSRVCKYCRPSKKRHIP